MDSTANKPSGFATQCICATVLLLSLAENTAQAQESYQIEVNILSTPIKGGETTIGTAKRGDKLTVRAANADYYLVDLPGAKPPQQGWIAKQDVHRVEDRLAELKRRIPLLPADKRKQAIEDFKSQVNDLFNLEKRFNELDAKHLLRQSLPLARQIAKTTEELFGGMSTSTAEKLETLGNCLQRLGDYPAAHKYHEQALAIRREVLGEKHAHTASSLNNLGVVAENMGDYTAARKYHEQALAIRREVLGEKHAQTADSLNNLGCVADDTGDYAAARNYYEQALAIRREVLGEKHADTASSLNNLGVVAQDMGDYATARKYHEQALTINREVLGEKHAQTADSLNNLGLVARETGEYVAARKYHEQALAIQREVLGEKHVSTAASLNNLGIVAQAVGDYPAARNLFEQALAINREVFGEKHADTAASLNNLGTVASLMGDYEAAGKYHEQALAIQRGVLGEKHVSTAASLNNLGDVAEVMGDYPAARKYYEQALAIQREVVGEKHTFTSNLLNNLGTVAYCMGDYPAARKRHEQALVISREVVGEKHADTARSEINLSVVEAAAGDWKEAAERFEQARRSARRHIARTLPALSEKEQLAFLQNTDDWALHRSLSLGVLCQEDASITAASGVWLVNGKAVAEESLAERTRLAREAKTPAARQALEDWKSVGGQLSGLSQKVPPPDKQAAWRQQIAELEAKEQELARNLAAFGAELGADEPWITFTQLQEKLPKNAILVDIVKFRPYIFTAKGKEPHEKPAHYVAWLIPPAGDRRVEIVDLGDVSKLEPLVAAARKTLDGADKRIKAVGEAAAEREVKQILRELAAAALDPILAHTGSAKRLLLSPDGALWLAPFAALPLADGHYAIEKYQIDYLVSGRELLGNQVRNEYKPRAPVLMANPDFDLAPAEAMAQAQEVIRKRLSQPPGLDTVAMRGASDGSFSGIGHVDRLPGTAGEASMVSPGLEKFGRMKPLMFLDKQALKGVFKQLTSPQALVLSTHGFFLSDQEAKQDEGNQLLGEHRGAALATDGKPLENPLLRCGLLLAGYNRRNEPGAEDDGILTGMDIVGTDLRGTELVVLSACQTGIGDVHAGQGVAGLRQAFQLAGAKRVVATLWRIPDEETSYLMANFFDNLAGGKCHGAGDALRQAQLQIIATRRGENNAAHPLYWAAFTLTGASD